MSRLILIALAVVGLAVAGCGGDNPTTPVTPIPDVAVASVELTAASSSVAIGSTLSLTATPRAANGAALPERAIAWSATPANVITVSAAGVVTGIALGTATVTATVEGKSAQRTITVHAIDAPVASVTVNTALDTLEAYEVLPMTAILKDTLGNTVA